MTKKLLLLLALLQFAPLPFVSSKAVGSQREYSLPPRTIQADELRESIEEWDRDYAVLFHSKYCVYCRQFKPIWHQISKLYAGTKNLDVVSFDCEATTENKKLCIYAGVQQYPSVMFVGHGSFMQNDPISSLFRGVSLSPEKTIMYQGELYLAAVRDWTRAMRFISTLSRWHSTFMAIIGREPSNQASELKRLRRENALLKEGKKITDTASPYSSTSSAAEQGDTSMSPTQHQELIKKYKTKEDSFAVLGTGEYGHNETTSNSNSLLLAIRQCVAEVAWEHCAARVKAGDATGGSAYCGILQECYADDFKTAACRPDTCPLDEQGCELTSICMNPDIVKRYLDKSSGTTATQAKKSAT